ncbi:MAG: hypothetical protein M3069_18155 [Chloroflexota bacterium]|nr:hypothetical protein [Chloroflexota bacterium]
MAAVVDPPQAPRTSVASPPAPAGSPGISAAANTSIDAYLGAGDGMASIMGSTVIVCAALLVLIAAAWAIGVLPGAVRLF